MLQDMNLKEFLEQTASKAPVPGGGSVAALSASLSISLIEMVANLTLGKKKYEECQEEMQEIVKIGVKYRAKFVNDIDRDSEAFNGVMACFKMSKGTEEEKNARKKEMQKALKNAALIPLEIAEDAYKLMDLALKVVEDGNKNAVTDGAVAAMMARTAVLSALYNVKINLGSIKDEEFVNEIGEKVKELENNINDKEKEILSKVEL